MDKIRTCITGIRLNEKTFKNVSFSPSLINFFFGGNGAGKSTIGRAIRAKRGLEWDSPASSELRLMVFNEDYIRENIQSYANIPGVFSLTEEDAAVRKELDEKTKEKTDAEAGLKKEEQMASALVNQELATKEKHWGNVWNKTLTWKKTTFAKAVPGYGNSKKNLFEELYKRPRVQGDEAALLSSYKAVFETEPVHYQPYTTINTDCLPETELLRKPIISMSDTQFATFVRALGNLDWVRAGHDRYLPHSDGRCPFCQGPIDTEKFERNLASCYDDQYRSDLESLKTFVANYKAALNNLYKTLKANQDNPYPLSEDLAKAYQYEFDMFMERARANVTLLEQKQQEPATEITDFEDLSPYLLKISDVIGSINRSISDYMVLVNDPKKKAKLSDDIWSFMAYECRGLFEDYDRDMERSEAEKKANAEAITTAREKVRLLSEEIAKLNTYTANTTDVMNSINDTLRSIGFMGFHLREKPGTSYIYELIRENEDGVEETAKDLSEGERNFIAFLYFYHTVMGSQNRNGVVEDKIVVIDDPVSSMDHNTLFYVSTLTREMIEVCYRNYALDEDEDKDNHIQQILCLTHNPVYFRDISYDRLNDYDAVTFFEITKDASNHTHVDEKYEEKHEAGGGRINQSPVRNYYDSLWHIFRTTESKEILMSTSRQIIDYHFLQSDGYKSTTFRSLIEKKREEFTKKDPVYYNIAVSMVALLDVGTSNFNDGMYFDSAPYSIDQMRSSFRVIFEVMGRMPHYNRMMGLDEE